MITINFVHFVHHFSSEISGSRSVISVLMIMKHANGHVGDVSQSVSVAVFCVRPTTRSDPSADIHTSQSSPLGQFLSMIVSETSDSLYYMYGQSLSRNDPIFGTIPNSAETFLFQIMLHTRPVDRIPSCHPLVFEFRCRCLTEELSDTYIRPNELTGAFCGCCSSPLKRCPQRHGDFRGSILKL